MPSNSFPRFNAVGVWPHVWGLCAALLLLPLAESGAHAVRAAGFEWSTVAQVTAIDAYNRGVQNYKSGNLRAALADYSTALSMNPGLVEAWYNRGVVNNALGDHSGAVVDFDRALSVGSRLSSARLADIHVNRAFARSRLGNRQGALADYNQALALDPRNSVAYLNRGRLQALAGNWTVACRDFRQATALGHAGSSQFLNSSAGAHCRDQP